MVSISLPLSLCPSCPSLYFPLPSPSDLAPLSQFSILCIHAMSEMSDLGYVLRILHEKGLLASWKQIGQTLKVDVSAIHGDPSLCLLQVVAAWLRGETRLEDPPSWWRVVWAVADKLGGNKYRQAREIALRYKGVCAKISSRMISVAEIVMCAQASHTVLIYGTLMLIFA